MVDHLPNLLCIDNLESEDTIQNLIFRKAIWSKNPKHPDFIMVILCRSFFGLMYWKQGDRRWTMLRPTFSLVGDAVFYKEKLYLVSGSSGHIVALDLLHQEQEMVVMMMPLLDDFDAHKYKNNYLAVGPSGLLLIGRH
ncbi:hypothetical protein QJS10_CPB19g00498 [Acorus calamus]|uniref:KIB1-4 beta-propeller domain-containing protein n=1 Tax=Acorus calamus TaxID=4465 RepID=A0AAV9CGL0_ACOCL|nr:hypothetical protein QJS10_CPB19g00498 [Acorus calamus]